MSPKTEAKDALDFLPEMIEPAPADDLDQSSEPESPEEQLKALIAEVEKEAPMPMLRKGTLSDPLPRMTAVEKMIDFINTTRRLPIEKIESRLVNESMPVMLWKLREFALTGQYTQARAIEIWLNWATKVQSRPKRLTKDSTVASGAAFDARLTKADVIETTAKAVPEKKTARKKALFGNAGVFIGKDKVSKK